MAHHHALTLPPPPPGSGRARLHRRAPDRLWVADLTYLRCWEGLVFFAFVIDAFSRRVVGWQLAAHMRTTLVLDALRMALGTRAPGADSRSCITAIAGRQPDSTGRRNTGC